MSRTTVLLTNHIQAIVDHITTTMAGYTADINVGFGERPKKPDGTFYDPPYIVISHVAGGTLDGPLSDSQADHTIRVLIMAMGNTAREALVARDLAHAEMMDKSNFTITGRKIRDISVEVPSDGAYRDDDVQTPIFYTRQIYLLDTTPS